MRRYTVFTGSTINTISRLGTAPINGPKKGMILVTPIITLIMVIYGIFITVSATKVIIPMIRESMMLPEINPPKIR